ncbi:hypothetical protein N7510_002052 [Penicillium lagena]|uniref:uncharacterized protein n=1 Tax=Penicillium lagena TaxID=94218 RepID=UPI00254020E4|nr:uncharacterized protein N7510_002052 [Penicillium lagena]KAJ5625743.1 hypothetical protein N7510_002052 [Penicillium lagena]
MRKGYALSRIIGCADLFSGCSSGTGTCRTPVIGGLSRRGGKERDRRCTGLGCGWSLVWPVGQLTFFCGILLSFVFRTGGNYGVLSFCRLGARDHRPRSG